MNAYYKGVQCYSTFLKYIYIYIIFVFLNLLFKRYSGQDVKVISLKNTHTAVPKKPIQIGNTCGIIFSALSLSF